MSDDFDKQMELYRENEKYLKIFENSLKDAGLKEKTIKKHLSNMDFYLNTYLIDHELENMREGINFVSFYLGNWFIRKALWSTATAIRENIASFKKFYKCMLENDFISKNEYDELLETIKDEKNDWISAVNRYNNGDISDFVWW